MFIIEAMNVGIFYNRSVAVKNVSLQIPRNNITANTEPSGCGKSLLLRSLNRMNDLIPGAEVEGLIYYQGKDI